MVRHRVPVHALFAGIRCSSADSTGAGEEAWLVRMSGWAESRSPKGSPLEFGFRNSVEHRLTTNGRFRSNLISVFLACLASVITSKAANGYHFKTGQRDWPSRTENVLPCRLLWWQVGFGAPASGAALEHVAVVQ